MSARSGVSLIELLAAIFIMTIVVSALSLQLPMNSRNIAANRQQWMAAHLASSEIASLQNQLYASVDTTDTVLGYAFNTNCDCSAFDFSQVTSTTTQEAGTTYSVASCVNFSLQNSYNAQCGPTDTGIKHIIVQVSWGVGASSHTITQGTSITAS